MLMRTALRGPSEAESIVWCADGAARPWRSPVPAPLAMADRLRDAKGGAL